MEHNHRPASAEHSPPPPREAAGACPCPGPGPCLCPSLSPRPGPLRTRSSPGTGAREPGAVDAPTAHPGAASCRPGPRQGPRRMGRCSATSRAESCACVSLCLCACLCVSVCVCSFVSVYACARTGGGLGDEGRGRKQGGKKKREKNAESGKIGDITVICIGAGIKPPRQRAPFILACGAAAAASGGTEHHRAATPSHLPTCPTNQTWLRSRNLTSPN